MAFAKTRFQTVALAAILSATVFAAGILETTCAAMAQDTTAIGVTVDGNQITFPGTQPVELHGSVLVPLRGVFQALGAHVDYDSASQIVTAHKHGRTIVVPIGSSTATIDGQPQQLSVPAQIIDGSTMVPLRFVAEALGDYVEWGAQTHMVTITSAQQAPDVVPAPHHDFNGGADTGAGVLVKGFVRRVDLDSRPRKLIVLSGGQDTDVPVGHDAVITRGPVGHDAHPAGLDDIKIGDFVIVHENDHGFAVQVDAKFK